MYVYIGCIHEETNRVQSGCVALILKMRMRVSVTEDLLRLQRP